MGLTREGHGTLSAAASVLGAALVPVMTYTLKGDLHPAAFALALVLPGLASCLAFRAAAGRPLGALLGGPDLPCLALVGLFGSVVPLTLLATLAGLGVPGPTVSVLLLSEVVVSFAFGSLLLGERLRARHAAAATAVVAGAALAVAGGPVALPAGWPLALLVPLSWQLGHLTFRSRLAHRDPQDVLCARLLYGSLLLLAAYPILVPAGARLPAITAWDAARLAAAGVVCNHLQLSLWYEALARINLSKATTIMMTYPAASFAIFTLGGAPASPAQWAGLAVATAGAVAAGLMPSERRP